MEIVVVCNLNFITLIVSRIALLAFDPFTIFSVCCSSQSLNVPCTCLSLFATATLHTDCPLCNHLTIGSTCSILVPRLPGHERNGISLSARGACIPPCLSISSRNMLGYSSKNLLYLILWLAAVSRIQKMLVSMCLVFPRPFLCMIPNAALASPQTSPATL